MTHGITSIRNTNIIINVGKNFCPTLLHDKSDGVRHHLECCAPMRPPERDALVQKVQTIPLDAKFQSVNRIHLKVSECSSHINFVNYWVILNIKYCLNYIINCMNLSVNSWPSKWFLTTWSLTEVP